MNLSSWRVLSLTENGARCQFDRIYTDGIPRLFLLDLLLHYRLREQFKLPSQMACNVPRQVGATYKSLRTKLKHNEEAIKAGRTKKRYSGHTSKENRPNKGLTFVCQQCSYTLHADLVGARNVALRVLLSRQDWESTGRFSAVPDVSGDETKTDYRLRYSGLRWSQDTIPNFNVAESSDEAK